MERSSRTNACLPGRSAGPCKNSSNRVRYSGDARAYGQTAIDLGARNECRFLASPTASSTQFFRSDGDDAWIPSSRSTQDKLILLQRFFSGLPDVYGTYDPDTGHAWQVKSSVTREVLLAHLIGRQPYGVYLLTGEMTRAVAADFDDEDLNPPMEFVAAARHYGISAYVECSKSKGYHVWIFFGESGVPARKARLVVHHILCEIQKPRSEVFPKQDAIDTAVTCGNFINAPLFSRLVGRGSSCVRRCR
ncbi:MAG: hypothetical protein KA354_23845 [Phycisphaerae bacterium]|nr:hypothetical protein [Phycisphaerae bacterium]